MWEALLILRRSAQDIRQRDKNTRISYTSGLSANAKRAVPAGDMVSRFGDICINCARR